MHSRNEDASSTPPSTPPSAEQWVRLYSSITEQCAAVEAEVAQAQAYVTTEVVPRLEDLRTACDACDVTLRELLRWLHQSARDDAAEATTSRRQAEKEHHAIDASNATSVSTSTPPSHAAQTLQALEWRLDALARDVGTQQLALHRTRQQQALELQELRSGIAQMDASKEEMMSVLRQLQLDKVALLALCAQHERKAALASVLAPRPSAQTDALTLMQEAGAAVTPADRACVASLESAVRGVEVLIGQEREAREAQVNELAVSLQRLEQLQRMRERGYTHPPNTRGELGPAYDGDSSYGDPTASPLGTIEGSRVRGASTRKEARRELRYPAGVVASPAPLNSRERDLHSPGLTQREQTQRHSSRASSDRAAASAAAAAGLMRDRLARFYAIYDPRMVPAVAELVREYRGPPEELFAALEMEHDAYGYFSHDS